MHKFASNPPSAPSAFTSDLIGRLRKGDEAGFKAFFDANFAHLYRFAHVRLARDEAATGEVVRATLCEVIRNLIRLHSEAHAGLPILVWVQRLCRLEIREWQTLRAREASRRLPIRRIQQLREAIVERADDLSGTGLDQQEVRIRLFVRTCDRLPEMEATALELSYVGDCSIHEVARLLDLTPAAAQRLLVRARELFQRSLLALPEEQPSDVHPR